MKQHSAPLHPLIEEIREANPVPRLVRGHGHRREVSRRHPDHPIHRQEARALIRARLRVGISTLLGRGYTPKEVSRILGITEKSVQARMEESLKALQAFDAEQERLRSGELFEEDLTPTDYATRSAADQEIPVLSGDILPDPDEYRLQKDAFELRTKAIPYHEIAAILGCTEQAARLAVKRRLHYLEQDELTETGLARRLQIEQIDTMIRGIFEDATVPSENRAITFNAIDRMVKLMEAKAKLLGLNAPQRVDIEERLVIIAKERSYDLEELRDIAAEVVAARSAGAIK